MIRKSKTIPRVLKALFFPKIFCISIQRTGTTSLGDFFRDHNYSVATWGVSRKNNWTVSWFKGDYRSIYNSIDFKLSQVFEDDPWFCLDYYKVLFHHFPKSKFVLLERDPDKWFDSMVSHSGGKSLGNTHLHATIYQRLDEFYAASFKIDNRYNSSIDNLLSMEEKHRKHYTSYYKLRNKEVKDFFERFGKDRIVNVQLEDSEKWQKIGSFFNLNVDSNYEIHSNKGNL